jgi:hypothetical protein
MKLSLALTGGRVGSANSYTNAERALAMNIAQCIGTACGLVNSPCKDASINAIASVVVEERAAGMQKGQQDSVSGICRAVYKRVEEQMLSDNKTTEDFPKLGKDGKRAPRDWASIGLLFRGALKELKVDQKTIDTAFAPTYAKKSA